MASRSAAAVWMLTPGLRRPISWRRVYSGVAGSQKLELKALNSGGMMPMRVVGLPLRTKIVPRILGSPANSRCQRR